MKTKLIAIIALLVIPMQAFGAYTNVECSSQSAFVENSCTKCFNGGEKAQGDYIGLLSDIWENTSDMRKILYKEEQTLPEMINLAGSDAVWGQTPGKEGFWEYTEDFENLYSDSEEGYILEPGASVTWLQSALSYAFKLETNTAAKGTNVGLLVFPLSVHNILEDGEITIDNIEHRECVLYKSSENEVKELEEPKALPVTGPAEYLLLALIAIMLTFGYVKFVAKS